MVKEAKRTRIVFQREELERSTNRGEKRLFGSITENGACGLTFLRIEADFRKRILCGAGFVEQKVLEEIFKRNLFKKVSLKSPKAVAFVHRFVRNYIGAFFLYRAAGISYHERVVFDTVKFRRHAGRLFTWLSLLAIAAAPRVAMMFTVARRLDADESIVGLMAKHIAHGGGVPYFFYGQNYGGGHVIEALIAAPFIFLAGRPVEWAVHIAPLVFSVATVALVYIYVGRLYGSRTAFAAAVMLSFSTPYLKSSLKSDGYIETIFLCVLAVVFFQGLERACIEGARKRQFAYAGLTGAALGLAFWSYDFALVYAAALVVLGLRRVWLDARRAGMFAGGFAAGAAPLIAFNLTNNCAHLKHLAGGGAGGPARIEMIPARAAAFFIRELPAFLTPDCTHNFVYPIPWYAWVFAGALAAAVILLIANRRRVPGVMAAAPAFLFAAYVASGYGGRSPRYLLPLEPFISIAAISAVAFLQKERRHLNHLLAVWLFAAFAVGMGGGLAALFSDNTIVEGNVKTNPESLVKIVRKLDEKKISCVETTYFIKWRILFLSDERINAMDAFARERNTTYLKYEEQGCAGGAKPAYVLHKASRYRYALAAAVNRNRSDYEIFYTTDHLAVIPVKKRKPEVRAGDAAPTESETGATDEAPPADATGTVTPERRNMPGENPDGITEDKTDAPQ
jgi:hypothetical protein